jgi:hypothetical protein
MQPFVNGFCRGLSFANTQTRASCIKKWRCIEATHPLNGGASISLKNADVLGAAAKRQIYWLSSKLRHKSASRYILRSSSRLINSKAIESSQEAIRCAQCWAAKAPAKVLPHHQTSTGLFFSEAMRAEYVEHLDNFKALMTFEEIETDFPDVAKWLNK